jgi:hypothetical protein
MSREHMDKLMALLQAMADDGVVVKLLDVEYQQSPRTVAGPPRPMVVGVRVSAHCPTPAMREAMR